MDYATAKSKFTTIRSAPRHTIIYRKYLCEVALQAKLVRQSIKSQKDRRAGQKTPRNDKSFTETF